MKRDANRDRHAIEQGKEWRRKNKAHIKAYFATYYEKKKAEISETRKNRYRSDPEYRAKCIALAKAYAKKKAEKA